MKTINKQHILRESKCYFHGFYFILIAAFVLMIGGCSKDRDKAVPPRVETEQEEMLRDNDEFLFLDTEMSKMKGSTCVGNTDEDSKLCRKIWEYIEERYYETSEEMEKDVRERFSTLEIDLDADDKLYKEVNDYIDEILDRNADATPQELEKIVKEQVGERFPTMIFENDEDILFVFTPCGRPIHLDFYGRYALDEG